MSTHNLKKNFVLLGLEANKEVGSKVPLCCRRAWICCDRPHIQISSWILKHKNINAHHWITAHSIEARPRTVHNYSYLKFVDDT